MKLYLAPLQGFTDRVFRNSFCRFFSGFDLAIAPFISALQGGRHKKKEMRDVLPEHNCHLTVIPQIMGNKAEEFVTVADHLYDLGYETVNWNLGCPFKMVAKKAKGSGLLCYPDRIDAFLDTVLPMMKPRLSIKMRLGRYEHHEMDVLAPILNRYPLDEITLHPRTGVQMYAGSADLDAFDHARDIFTHTLIYNGDIRTHEDFLHVSRRFTDIDRWMIGRGVLSDPFLPMTIKKGYDNLRTTDKIQSIKLFHDDYYIKRLEYLSGPAHITDRMKSFWTYLAPSLDRGAEFFKDVKKVKNPEQYDDVVERYFDQGMKWIGPGEYHKF